ncbi:hypothetical protein THOM_3266, partial [Trachipleistophora hominis]
VSRCTCLYLIRTILLIISNSCEPCMADQFNKIFFKKLAHIFDKYKNKDDTFDEGIDIINCNSSELDEMCGVKTLQKNNKHELYTSAKKTANEYEFAQDYEDIHFSRINRRIGKVIVREKACSFSNVYERRCVNNFDDVFNSVFRKL